MQPKLIAAADMCEAGEEVNLDELAFLLRYAADEIVVNAEAVSERDRLLERTRNRVLARCDLLERGEKDQSRAKEGSLEELELLDDELDREVKKLVSPVENPTTNHVNSVDTRIFQSGR